MNEDRQRQQLVPQEDNNPFRRGQDARPKTALTEVLSQREIAEIQGMLVIARRFPRDQVLAMDQILQDCTLPALAEAATYEYHRGGSKIEGVTIRLAEAVARRWGNLRCGVKEISRDEGSSECMAYAWDLETGYYEERTFQVPHWRDTQQGGKPLTDERDIYELVANMGARRKRACILAVIPMDVFDRAWSACDVSLRSKITVDDDTLAGLLDKLAEFGVTKEMIEKRLGRRFSKETITPGMILQLRKIYNSLYDKMSVLTDWFKPDRAGAGSPVEEERTASGRKRPQKKKEPEPPADPEAATKVADETQLKMVRDKAAVAAITDAEICKAFGLQKLEDLRAAVVPGVMKWLGDPSSKPA